MLKQLIADGAYENTRSEIGMMNMTRESSL